MLWVVDEVFGGLVLWCRHSLGIIIHCSLILISCCHAVSFVAFPIIVEQGFRRWLSAVVEHLYISVCLHWDRQTKAVLIIMRGFWGFVTESCQLMVGECLICLPCRYHWLFHCEVSCHCTNVKVQYGGLVPSVKATLGSPSSSGTVNTKTIDSVPILVYWSSVVCGS